MPSWFLCKIRYRKEADTGKVVTINEQYVVDSVSFTDAEARLLSRLMDTHKDYTLASAGPMRLADVFHYEDSETWYKAKVWYESIDEKSGKPKKVFNIMLVTAGGVKQACDRIEESLSTMLVPFTISGVEETKIVDIFPYQSNE